MAVRIIVRMILRKENKILFLRQRNSMGGAYTLPGGKLDPNETALEAGIRENYEETGLKIDPKNVKLVHNLFVKKGKGSDDDLFMVFKTKKWKGVIKIKEPEKFKQVVWLDIEKINTMNVVPIANHIVNQYLKKNRYSDLILVK